MDARARTLALCTVLLVGGARGAFAQSTIYQTRKAPSSTWSPIFPLTIGSGLEFSANDRETRWEFPVLIQYNFTPSLQLTLEPSFAHTTGKVEDVTTAGGLGDLETSLDWEFLHERRWTPAIGLEGTIRWPTASHPELGDDRHDYAVGLVISKDCVFFDLDSNITYTFAGDRDESSKLEVTLAAEYPVRRNLALNAELVQSFETGPGHGHPTEFTFGFSWHANAFWTLEYGTELDSGGDWKQLLGWQYSFGGND